MENINVLYESPTATEYINLRVKAGLSPKSVETAEIGLNNSIFTVTLRKEELLIGMGRIIGDGGCFYQIVDIAIDPSYQEQGLGKRIMSEIINYLDQHALDGAYVSLIADVPADKLYKKFGFEYTSPKSLGMYKKY